MSFRALGTGTTVAVCDPRLLDRAVGAARETIEEFDRSCSRFREDSDLSRLNRSGGTVTVHGVLREAIAYALAAARTTNGVVDPTIGASMRAIGYDRDFAGLPDNGAPVIRYQRAAGWHIVEFDESSGRVTLPRGVLLDLGATAKALAADRAAANAVLATGEGVLVSIGGDVAAAGPAPDNGWMIRVSENHADPDTAPGETIALRGGGVATSSSTVRGWQRGGQRCHHLVDPRDGKPASTAWRTVSVAASSCAGANVASTAAMVLGVDSLSWLQSLGLPCRMVTAGGHVHYVGPWPLDAGDQERPLTAGAR